MELSVFEFHCGLRTCESAIMEAQKAGNKRA